MLRVLSSEVFADVIARAALLLALVGNPLQRRSRSRQLDLADQHLLLAGLEIDVPQLTLLAGIIALHERDFGVTWTPLHRLRFPPSDSPLGKDGLDGQGLLLGRCRLRKGQSG